MTATFFLAVALVLNGTPTVSVVVESDAHPATQTAAIELTNWVCRITGAELKVVGTGGGVERTIAFA